MKNITSMRSILIFCLIAISTGLTAQSNKKTEFPNILFIAVDDLRPEINAYGAEHMKTPNIDRLAEEGVMFERAYCQQAICMASRTSILSGLRPEYKKLYNCDALINLAPEILTLNEHLANHGFETYSIGKIYHHGSDRSDQFGDNWFDPTNQYAGRGYISDEAIAEIAANEHFDQGKKNKGPAYEMLDVPDNYYIDGVNAEHAIEKLKEYRKSDQPFFLGFGLHKPHLPWCAPKKYWDMYPPETIDLSPTPDFPEGLTPYSLTNWGELRGYFGIPQGKNEVPDELAIHLRRAYYASVSYADAQIGKVMEALDKYGLRENTIVILWGDHGWKLGDHNAWSKHTNFEYDTRVPMIISAPGMTNKGKSTRSFAGFVDIYPTLCDLTGIPLPDHLHGQSLVPVLEDTDKNLRDFALSIFPRNRREDEKTITGFSMRTDDYRYTEWIHLQSGKAMASELYDHQMDPMETKNVVNEDSYRLAAKKLSTLLHQQYDDAIPGIARWTDVTLYDPADLEMTKNLAKMGKSPYVTAVDSLKAEADRLLDDGPWSVMEKNKVPPSGNMHDYYSLGIYWYSDPDKEDGLPYIRKDGYRNPEWLDYDSPALKKTIHSVSTLAQAWFYTAEEKYAEKATEVLNTWFLDPETKMNPHLEYGQAIPGITEGRGIGIIETEGLVKVVNGIELLKNAEALSSEQYTQLKNWFADYTEWLLTSENGWDERMWHNNHGSAYDFQTSTYALFTGMDSVARMLLDSVKVKRIARQVEADGSQPWELERTKAMGYSIKNTRLLIDNAILADKIGIDLWNYQDEEGGSILKSIEFLLPFFAEDKAFPYEQIGGIEQYRPAFNEILWITGKYIPEKEFNELLNGYKIDMPAYSKMHLLYPLFNEIPWIPGA